MPEIYVGQASWSIPKAYADAFPVEGSHLERFARRLTGVEINTSFYRPHRPSTYARWAASVPEHFRFAVKAPQEITHHRGLEDSLGPLEDFLDQSSALGEKRGPLLFQLPPRLSFDAAVAPAFFQALRERYAGPAVFEPRHRSWFHPEVEALLARWHLGRVAADPARVPEAGEPGGYSGYVYFRWHGSPRMYYSAYSEAALRRLAALATAAAAHATVWCVFDNTTVGEATGNALELSELLGL